MNEPNEDKTILRYGITAVKAARINEIHKARAAQPPAQPHKMPVNEAEVKVLKSISRKRARGQALNNEEAALVLDFHNRNVNHVANYGHKATAIKVWTKSMSVCKIPPPRGTSRSHADVSFLF